jgi:hypothetical protein
MSDHGDDIPLLYAAMDDAVDGIVQEADLDAETAATMRRWPVPEYGPPGAGYWLTEDLEDLLDGCA